jgi:2-dehydro-3-deoxygalactonokinase
MADLIAFGDWGTSRLRLGLYDGDTQIEAVEGPGIGALNVSPAETLLGAVASWRERRGLSRVLLAGMAGSRTGVVEAPYAECPAGVDDWARQAATVMLDGLSVEVAPGVAGTAPSGAPDVMRGEETQVFGALALHPDLAKGDHVFVLPGTHGKWCQVRDGRIVGFQTFLTGELFALLSTRSSLLLGADATENAEHEAAGFAHGLERARAGHLLSALFEARSAQLREGCTGAWARGFLSGLTIGTEVAEGAAAFKADRVILVGASALNDRYATALGGQSVENIALGGEVCVLAGLKRFALTHRQA